LWAVPLVLHSRWRRLGWTLGLALGLAVILPATILGWSVTLEYLDEVRRAVGEARLDPTLWAGGAKDQALEQVARRAVDPEWEQAASLVARGFAGLLGIATLLRWRAVSRGSADRMDLGLAIALLFTPMVVSPSWPHALAHLPFVQGFLACELARRMRGAAVGTAAAARVRWSLRLAAAVILLSVVLAAVPTFVLVGDHVRHGALGLLALANLVLFLPIWCLLARDASGPAGDGDQTQPDGRG
jgi:hypothetical protein